MKSMKKTFLALLVAVLSIGVANAEFRFGVKVGLNVNNIKISNAQELKDNAAGFTGGVMADFTVPLIGIGADASIMYTRMNSQPSITTSPDGASLLTVDQNKNFLEIPINLKYKFKLPVVGSFVAPYIFTGPDFAIKLGKNTVNEIKTKTCQVAWNVGLGVELVNHLQIGASYGFGINNIAKKVAGSYIDVQDLNLKNNYWTVTAAYLF